MRSRVIVDRLLFGTGISLSLSVWLYALNRNLSIPYIGDSLGYVSRARNMAELGIMNHAPIEPFGVPLQSMGYSLFLSFVPETILDDDRSLRILVSATQIFIYLFSVWFFGKTLSLYSKFKARIVYMGLALFWPALIVSTEVMADSLSLSLHILILSILIRALHTNLPLNAALILGVLYGTLIITRPSSLVVLPIIVIVFIRSHGNWKISKPLLVKFLAFTVIVSTFASPQVIWTYQQFGKLSLIELDDSYTNGIPISIGEQNARATLIQLNGCAPPVDCELINRYPGPFSWRSYEALDTDFPLWNEWFLVEPGYATLQAGLILLASLDQEFLFTYVKNPDAESNPITLFVLIVLLISGTKFLFRQVRLKESRSEYIAPVVACVLLPYLLTQLLLFHAENRYGLVPASLMFCFGILNIYRLGTTPRRIQELIVLSAIAVPVTILSWKNFVAPFL